MELFGISEGIIVQQVNCCGVMGAGLAKAILDKYPQVKEGFDDYYKSSLNDGKTKNSCCYSQLGSFQIIPLDKPYKSINELASTRDLSYLNDSKLKVANIYSQAYYGNAQKTGKVYTKLPFLINSIDVIANFYNENIYVPIGIGCGYGGEDWERVSEEIENLQHPNVFFLDTRTLEVLKTFEEEKEL